MLPEPTVNLAHSGIGGHISPALGQRWSNTWTISKFEYLTACLKVRHYTPYLCYKNRNGAVCNTWKPFPSKQRWPLRYHIWYELALTKNHGKDYEKLTLQKKPRWCIMKLDWWTLDGSSRILLKWCSLDDGLQNWWMLCRTPEILSGKQR